MALPPTLVQRPTGFCRPLTLPPAPDPPPNRGNLRLAELATRIVRFSSGAWTLGVVPTAFEGVRARITNPARTIADCFRFEHLVGPEAPMEALQDALRQRSTTIAELGRMERALPSRRLRAALDVRSL